MQYLGINMTCPLDNMVGPHEEAWQRAGRRQDLEGLVNSGKASERRGKSPKFTGGSFYLVYNAAHALCLAALRLHGYRPANSYIVFQVLHIKLTFKKVQTGLNHVLNIPR